jgi:formiminotetrahydrofolate cyclodeaminase
MSQPTDAFTTLLSSIAAKQPTPGGGAVAAMVGALAAAIGEMALNYSVGRKATAAEDPQFTAAINELVRAREVMLELMIEDQEAFAALTAAKQLEESDPRRASQYALAVELCVAVPQTIATTGLALLRLADRVADHANRWLLSDLAVCVELAMATIRSAQHSVRINLPELPVDRRSKIATACDEQLKTSVEIVNRVMPRIAARLSS